MRQNNGAFPQLRLSRNRHYFIKWLYTQFESQSLIKTFLVFSLFGFIPGGFFTTLFIVGSYAAVKAFIHRGILKREIKERVEQVQRLWARMNPNVVYQEASERIVSSIIQHPYPFLKASAAFLIIFTTPAIWGFFAIYGMYRFTYKEWQAALRPRINNFYHIGLGIFRGATRQASFKGKILAGLKIACIIAICAQLYGWLFSIDLIFSLLQLALFSVGITAALRDASYVLKNPLKVFTQHPGKIYGIFLGRWLALSLWPGRIIGGMGPAIGQVESHGVLSGLLSSFLEPSQRWFTFQTSLVNLLTSRLLSFINAISMSVFFSHNMRLHGDFYGVIGPTSFQIYLAMLLFCLLGYGIERIVDTFYVKLEDDFMHPDEGGGQQIKKASSYILNWLYTARWHIGYTLGAGAMPFVLTLSNGTAPIALAGGNVVAATLLTVGGVVSTFAAFYGVKYFLQIKFKKNSDNISASFPTPDLSPPSSTTLSSLPTRTFHPQYDQQIGVFTPNSAIETSFPSVNPSDTSEKELPEIRFNG